MVGHLTDADTAVIVVATFNLIATAFKIFRMRSWHRLRHLRYAGWVLHRSATLRSAMILLPAGVEQALSLRPCYPPARSTCSMLRSARALMVREGLTIPVLPGTNDPSTTYKLPYPWTRP